MTFEDIKKANETINIVVLKKQNKKTGEVTENEYAAVNQRIKAFRQCYPEGFIRTQMLSNENGVCVFRAEVGYYDSGIVSVILGTGTAYEKETSSFINQTSYIENCETSAVGRALGMCGFGIDTSVASYEEVANAIKNQEPKEDPAKQAEKPVEKPAEPVYTDAQLNIEKDLVELGMKAKVPIEAMLKQAGINRLADISTINYAKMKAALLKKIEKDSVKQDGDPSEV